MKRRNVIVKENFMPHISHVALRKNLDAVLTKIRPGERYFHYKNTERYYEIIDVGFLEETGRICIIYKSLYSDGIVWVRDLDIWDADVLYNGKTVKRFQKVVE